MSDTARDFRQFSLEERVARLEGKLGWCDHAQEPAPNLLPWAIICAVVGCVFCVLGLGLPNHYYQVVLAVLALAVMYHKGYLELPRRIFEYSLPLLNLCLLSMLLKLVIGGGVRFPFFWTLYPVLKTSSSSISDAGFLPTIPSLSLDWLPSTLASWPFDLTIVQTFLLIITLMGAMVEFQPFISLTAFLLIFVSLPSLISFDWPWVFPAMVAAFISFYLQTGKGKCCS